MGDFKFHIGIIDNFQVFGNQFQFSGLIVVIVNAQSLAGTQILPHSIIHFHLDRSLAGQRAIFGELHDNTGGILQFVQNLLAFVRTVIFHLFNLHIQIDRLDFLLDIAAFEPPGNTLRNQIQGFIRAGNGFKGFPGQGRIAAVVRCNIGIVFCLFYRFHKIGLGYGGSYIGDRVKNLQTQIFDLFRQFPNAFFGISAVGSMIPCHIPQRNIIN